MQQLRLHSTLTTHPRRWTDLEHKPRSEAQEQEPHGKGLKKDLGFEGKKRIKVLYPETKANVS